ncbi:hypothetical protein BZZ01_11660 [Nostocales cyanobacterium HT-58-2]|nr:hypothetical protein BZZ01_11660 [Nostocales cyanobacterium HT-58-2]
MTGFVLLAIGIGNFLLALKTKDEIPRITAVVAGAIFLIWGYTLTPMHFQLVVEISSVIAAFSICMRCLDCK